MILHAHSKGHPLCVFTTAVGLSLVGLSLEDVEQIRTIPSSVMLPTMNSRPVNLENEGVTEDFVAPSHPRLRPLQVLHPRHQAPPEPAGLRVRPGTGLRPGAS